MRKMAKKAVIGLLAATVALAAGCGGGGGGDSSSGTKPSGDATQLTVFIASDNVKGHK